MTQKKLAIINKYYREWMVVNKAVTDTKIKLHNTSRRLRGTCMIVNVVNLLSMLLLTLTAAMIKLSGLTDDIQNVSTVIKETQS